MALVYSENDKIFLKQNCKKHSGNLACATPSLAEAFFVNQFIIERLYNSEPFEFDTPSFYTLGGTLNYYGQDYWSVFTNISKPLIKFVFTANTSSFGTGTTMIHNIYRIPYKDYTSYTSAVERQNVENYRNYKTEITEETVLDEKGTSTKKTTTKKTTSSSSDEKLAPEKFPSSISDFDLESGVNLDKIKNLLSSPICTLTAATSGISTDTYAFFPDEYQKNLGDYEYQLFEDYGQYFITTQFQFQREISTRLKDFYQLDSEGKLVEVEYNQYIDEITPVSEHIITGGTFSGVTVHGSFFTYFLIPNKPILESPYVSGQLTTFAPTFFWSHVEDGDSYLLQVVYNSSDSSSFSGTVYSYPISKEESNLSVEEMLNSPDGDWSITQKTVDVIRKYSVPLWKGKTFWYRIGNVK
ncbi:MAG: hypothetical protein WC466_02105, partial [Candidatus Izemoplasmatales bacterium]